MKHVARLFDIRFLVIFLFFFSIIFLFPSCEEQIDNLWDDDDNSTKVNPLIGDWYADSIKSFYNCIKSSEDVDYELINEMEERSIDNYNVWLLSDGSLQLVFEQNLNLQYECDTWYDYWDSETGCGEFTPIEFCNLWYEHNEYNIETTDCSQNAFINGNWTSNEESSTITITMDSLCVNGWGNPSYISSPDACNELDESEYFEQMEKTFNYTINSETGNIDLEGSWFDNDSSCVMFHLSVQ